MKTETFPPRYTAKYENFIDNYYYVVQPSLVLCFPQWHELYIIMMAG